MNLDLLPLGWLHFVASLIALALALLVLVRPKGTPVHKWRGTMYLAVLLVTSTTALGIYRLGIFFFPHWFAVASLIATGFAAGHFKRPRAGWLQLHLTAMATSVYILVGGGVNEVFLRISVLKRLVATHGPAAIPITHLALIVLFAVLIAYFNATTLLHRRGARRVPSVGREAAD